MIFQSNFMSHAAANGNQLFIDGTFQCCPRGYKQLLVVLTWDVANQMYTPVCFALMQSKNPQSYIMALNAMKEICLEDGFDLEPEFITTDFELALLNSVSVVFPSSIVLPC